jgi:sugar phosphate isomerase/epimerase
MLTSLRSGFSTLGCPDFSLEDAFGLAEKYGVKSIELRSLEGSVDLPSLFKERYGTPQNLAEKRAAFAEIDIASLDTSFKLVGNTAEDRAAFLEYVPWAEALKVTRLRVFDGGKNGSDAEIGEAGDTADWWTDLRTARGWQTDWVIETHDAFVTTPLLRALLTRVPHCSLLWDAHHTWRKGGENPVVTWTALQESIVHIHVKDSLSRPSARHAFTYVLPGAGDFPITPLVNKLINDHFTGPVCLEWERLWHPYLSSLEEALKAANAAEGWK